MSELADAILNHLFRGEAMPAPTRLWIALYTDREIEVSRSGTGYQRVEILADGFSFLPPKDGETANTRAVVFPKPLADWGRIAAFAVLASSGVELFRVALIPKSVNAGDPAPEFPAGDLRASFRLEAR